MVGLLDMLCYTLFLHFTRHVTVCVFSVWGNVTKIRKRKMLSKMLQKMLSNIRDMFSNMLRDRVCICLQCNLVAHTIYRIKKLFSIFFQLSTFSGFLSDVVGVLHLSWCCSVARALVVLVFL